MLTVLPGVSLMGNVYLGAATQGGDGSYSPAALQVQFEIIPGLPGLVAVLWLRAA